MPDGCSGRAAARLKTRARFLLSGFAGGPSWTPIYILSKATAHPFSKTSISMLSAFTLANTLVHDESNNNSFVMENCMRASELYNLAHTLYFARPFDIQV
jgi:hypothetical protein